MLTFILHAMQTARGGLDYCFALSSDSCSTSLALLELWSESFLATQNGRPIYARRRGPDRGMGRLRRVLYATTSGLCLTDTRLVVHITQMSRGLNSQWAPH